MRKFQLYEYILSHPWLMALIGLALLAAAGFWLWSQMEESKASDRLANSERNRSDSIWKD